MNMTRSTSTSFLAFLAGAAAWAVFGSKIREAVSENEDVKEMKDSSREMYDQIVDEVTDQYARAKGISQNELKDLAHDLKSHWYRIKKAWNKGGDNA
jgi:hypothetical protein